MSIHIVCPQCGKSLDVPDSRVGQTEMCSCGTAITIPSPESPIKPSAVHDENGSISEECTPILPTVTIRPTALTVMIVIAETLSAILSLGALYYIVYGLSSSPSSGKPNVLTTQYIPIVVIGLFILALCFGTLVLCHFLRRGFEWARVTMAIIISIAVINILALKTAVFLPSVIVLLVLGSFFYILCMKETKKYCNK